MMARDEGINKIGVFSLKPLNKDKRRCPAIILAANRTDKVMGRIKFLTVSMKTIKKDNIIGVPKGTKCVNIWLVILIQPYIKNKNQKGSAKVKVVERCLVAVKI